MEKHMKLASKKILLLIALSIISVQSYAMETSQPEPLGNENPELFSDLPEELIISINAYLLPLPNQFFGEIIEKIEDLIAFSFSSKHLKSIVEAEVIKVIKKNINQYTSIRNSEKQNLLEFTIHNNS